MENRPSVDPALSELRSVASTMRAASRSVADLLDEAMQAGAQDLPNVLAYLLKNTTQLSGRASTKLALIQSNVRDVMSAVEKLADVLGVEAAPGTSTRPQPWED